MNARLKPVISLDVSVFHESRLQNGAQANLTNEEKKLSVLLSLLSKQYDFVLKEYGSTQATTDVVKRFNQALARASNPLFLSKFKPIVFENIDILDDKPPVLDISENTLHKLELIFDEPFVQDALTLIEKYYDEIPAAIRNIQASYFGGFFNWSDGNPQTMQVKKDFLQKLVSTYFEEAPQKSIETVLRDLKEKMPASEWNVIVSGWVSTRVAALFQKMETQVAPQLAHAE